jgi:serine/threonine protein kinase
MSGTDSVHGDDVFVELLKELESPGDGEEILRRYCKAHPDLADEFRALGATRQMLVMGSTEAGAGAGRPETLGDFRIKRAIARGGMGAIYEAGQGPFQRRVAVKTIRRDRHLSPAAKERFLREQEVLARLHHTHIVPIHAGGQEGELQYFAMPYIEGAALHHVVRSVWRHEATSPGVETPSLSTWTRSSYNSV